MAHPTDLRFPSSLLWRALWPLGRMAAAFEWRLAVEGRAPSRGPLVVAANHLSLLDPTLVGLAVRRPVRYLALKELYGSSRLLDALMKGFGAIPISRERPTHGPMRVALRHLAEGGAVGLFPEGRRVSKWGEVSPRGGAAWLALRSGAPLLPVAIVGSDRSWGLEDKWFRRAPVRIVLAAPLLPEDFRGASRPVEAMMQAWRDRVGRMMVGSSA